MEWSVAPTPNDVASDYEADDGDWDDRDDDPRRDYEDEYLGWSFRDIEFVEYILPEMERELGR